MKETSHRQADMRRIPLYPPRNDDPYRAAGKPMQDARCPDRPEEIAETIITVGDPDRVGEVSKHFDKIEYQNNHREFVTHTGYIGNKRISCVSTGIGPDNIDIVLNELDALVNIDFETRLIKEKLTRLNIIRFGTSGSLQNDIPVDSFVASTHGLGLDNLMHFYRMENNEEEKQIHTCIQLPIPN